MRVHTRHHRCTLARDTRPSRTGLLSMKASTGSLPAGQSPLPAAVRRSKDRQHWTSSRVPSAGHSPRETDPSANVQPMSMTYELDAHKHFADAVLKSKAYSVVPLSQHSLNGDEAAGLAHIWPYDFIRLSMPRASQRSTHTRVLRALTDAIVSSTAPP